MSGIDSKATQDAEAGVDTEDGDLSNWSFRAGWLRGLALKLFSNDREMVLRASRSLMCAGTEINRLKSALGEIGALGDRCEECEPLEAKFASHVTHYTGSGLPRFLCDEHAAETRAAFRKAESKGCGQPEIEGHEQDIAVQIALRALGEA